MTHHNDSSSFRSLARHDEYYLIGGDLHFLVEHIQFRVHRYFFDRESAYFHHKLATPASPGAVRQGTTDSTAIVLDDVKASDFAQFLWVFYNPKYSLYYATIDQWTSILGLAYQWQFPEVKKLCIRELEKLEMNDVDRIHVYHEYEVDRNLLIPRYAALCRREEPLTLPEGMKLGMETTLMIAKGREIARAKPTDHGARSPSRADIEPDMMTDLVKDVFNIPPPSEKSPVDPPTSPTKGVAVMMNGHVNGVTNGAANGTPAGSTHQPNHATNNSIDSALISLATESASSTGGLTVAPLNPAQPRTTKQISRPKAPPMVPFRTQLKDLPQELQAMKPVTLASAVLSSPNLPQAHQILGEAERIGVGNKAITITNHQLGYVTTSIINNLAVEWTGDAAENVVIDVDMDQSSGKNPLVPECRGVSVVGDHNTIDVVQEIVHLTSGDGKEQSAVISTGDIPHEANGAQEASTEPTPGKGRIEEGIIPVDQNRVIPGEDNARTSTGHNNKHAFADITASVSDPVQENVNELEETKKPIETDVKTKAEIAVSHPQPTNCEDMAGHLLKSGGEDVNHSSDTPQIEATETPCLSAEGAPTATDTRAAGGQASATLPETRSREDETHDHDVNKQCELQTNVGTPKDAVADNVDAGKNTAGVSAVPGSDLNDPQVATEVGGVTEVSIQDTAHSHATKSDGDENHTLPLIDAQDVGGAKDFLIPKEISVPENAKVDEILGDVPTETHQESDINKVDTKDTPVAGSVAADALVGSLADLKQRGGENLASKPDQKTDISPDDIPTNVNPDLGSPGIDICLNPTAIQLNVHAPQDTGNSGTEEENKVS